MPMTGRQIRLSVMPGRIQLFPWAPAIEVSSAVPETAELDSLLRRVGLHGQLFQSQPHAATALCGSDPSQPHKPMPRHCWPECQAPLPHLCGQTALPLPCWTVNFSPAACSTNGTVCLSFPSYALCREKKHLHLVGKQEQAKFP